MKVRQGIRGGREEPGEVLDLTALLRPYENQWVALSEDRRTVLGAGGTLQDAKRQADQTRKPYRFLKVLPFDVSFVPRGG